MRFPLLPERIELKLERDLGNPDAPVFVYRPLNMTEALDFATRLFKAREENRVLHLYAELFRERITEIRNITIGDGDEPFDPKNDAHMNALAAAANDVVEIGTAIHDQAQLQEQDAGKLLSPSS